MIKGPWPRQSTTATLWKRSVVVCLQGKREGARAVGRKKVEREREREREREKDIFVLVSNWLLLCDLTGFLHLSHIWHTKFSQVKFCFQTEETEAFVMAPKLPQLQGTLFKYGSKSIQVFVSPLFSLIHIIFLCRSSSQFEKLLYFTSDLHLR